MRPTPHATQLFSGSGVTVESRRLMLFEERL